MKVRNPTCIVLSLTEEQIFKNSSPEGIIKFLKEQRFSAIFDTRVVVIESRSWKSIVLWFQPTIFDASLYLSRTALQKISLKSIFQVFCQVFRQTASRGDLFRLRDIKSELFDKTIWRILIESNIEICIVATQSILDSKSVPFTLQKNTSIKKILVWYSTNSTPIIKKGFATKSGMLESRNVKNFDLHLVWNHSQRESLKQIEGVNIEICGPLLFQEKIVSKKDLEKKSILFFEVAPMDNADVFYNSQMSISTILSLVESVKKLSREIDSSIALNLKPKRSYGPRHNSDYLRIIESLKRRGDLVVFDYSVNLYEVISQSDLVVSVPYSSPAHIATELGIRSIYFAQDFKPYVLESVNSGVEVVTDLLRLDEILKEVFH